MPPSGGEPNCNDLGTMTTAGDILIVDDLIEVGESVCAAAVALQVPLGDHERNVSALNNSFSSYDVDLVRSKAIEEERTQGNQGSSASANAKKALCSRAAALEQSSPANLRSLLVSPSPGHLLQPFRTSELETLLEENARPESLDPDQNNPAFEIDDPELRTAINRKEFILHYQPQIDVANGSVVGLEAYVRWNHPKRGLLFPDSFLGSITAMGMFKEFGWLIADRGLSEIRQFSGWRFGIPRLTLRVSAEFLRDTRFPDTLASLVKKYGVPSHRVAVEVSGSGTFYQISSALDVLTQLRVKDVMITVDDYGADGVGIQELRQISATDLKISRKFVQNMFVKRARPHHGSEDHPGCT